MKSANPHPWLQLLRLPNLFTVPGDVLAGYALAHTATGSGNRCALAVLTIASLCVYSAGLLLNDWFDQAEDRVNRPERPLARGQVAAPTVFRVGLLLILFAIGLSTLAGVFSLLVMLGLVGLVVFYTGAARDMAAVGQISMGACRSFNVLLGASVALQSAPSALFVALAVEGGYVALLTWAADCEDERHLSVVRQFAPVLFMTAGMVLLFFHTRASTLAMAAGLVAIAYPLAGSLVTTAKGGKCGIRYIGYLVRTLIPMQAAFILVADPSLYLWAVALYVLLAIASITGRRISGS